MKLSALEKCTGCGACVNICPRDCIKLAYDEFGFLKPVIFQAQCAGCELCAKVCPIAHPLKRENTNPPRCYAGWNRNLTLRKSSSSGGIFPAIAGHVLSRGGSVFGVALNDEFHPIHVMIDKEQGLAAIQGSKYIQSDTGYVYRFVKSKLSEDACVLFSGCPCQVVGLYAYLNGQEFDKLLTCEVICHGVSSTYVFEWWVNSLRSSKIKAPVADINFRTKKYGWDVSAIEFILKNGERHYQKAVHSLWYRAYYGGHIVREACQNCPFASLPRMADITLGDYWHGRKINYPRYEIKQGISLILINNGKAARYFTEIRDQIDVKPISLSEALHDNTNIAFPGPEQKLRDEFLAEYKYCTTAYLRKKYFPRTMKHRIADIFGYKLSHQLKSIFKNAKR